MSEGSWFQKGFGGIKKEEERIASKYGPQRFWMPAGEKKLVVFLEDEPVAIYEHNPKMNGSWKNWVTCIRDVHPDEPTCCEELGGSYDRYYVGYFTVVDCSAWTDKQGNKYQYELKLYPAKLKTLKLLQAKSEEDWGGMAGKVIKIRRSSSDDASVGNDFEKDREADLEKLWKLVTYKGKKICEMFEKATQDEDERARLLNTFQFKKGENGILLPQIPTYNYLEVLKPKSPTEMKAYLRSGKIEDADGGSSKGGGSRSSNDDGGTADDSVPF